MKTKQVAKQVAVCVTAAFAMKAESAPVKPNIIFILADDISAKDLRCYNSNGIELPFIEKMAAEGIQFQTAWAAPVCGPSRAMLHTGKYPFKQGLL
jgi:arylsulfatase A